MNFTSRPRFLISFLLFLSIISAPLLNAQYFGRNKVQYETFDFKVLKTEHFDIYFYPENEKAAKQASRMAERWYARLSRIFNHELKGRQPLILYASGPHFQQTTAITGILGEGTGGVTESFKRRIILPLGASLAESDHVIGHELVHAFQYDLTFQAVPRDSSAPSPGLRVPLWLIEGLAEYLSIGPEDPHTAMWMRDITQRDKIPTVKKLEDPRYFPYRYGQALWAYITGKWGDSAVGSIMKGVTRAGNYKDVMEKVLGISLEDLSKDWQEAMKKKYNPLSKLTQVSEKSSRPLFIGTKMNPLNVSPALSPDGKQIIFLSTRDLFSIDMYLADARTGKIEQKLIKTAVNPHFESLQFIKSSGAWDAEGKRFVFGAISKGQPVLTIVNVEKSKTDKEVEFQELGEILNPTWSPDGRFIAFSAVVGGLTDIYLYDLGADTLKKMTDDSYADLYPAWSPDGRAIAFVTDRFSTALSILNIGNYELALMDPETGEIQKVPGFPKAKNINPQWSSDSKSLYFISDQNGISNIYRIELESQKIFQVTNLYTGVSGITGLSPALSIAQETGNLAYCLYEDDKYNIYALENLGAAPGEGSMTQFEPINPSVLPPREKPEGDVVSLLNNPLYGLPSETEFEIIDYQPKLSLDFISQPQLAVGVDRWGTYTAGGIAMFFSDMLGYRNLVTMFQVSNRIEDTAALVGYQNSRTRLNWGAVVQRIPYVTGGYFLYEDFDFNQPLWIEEEIIYRQINYMVSGFAYYPLNQAQRFELSGGYRMIDFDREVRTRAISQVTGIELYREKEKLPSPDSLHFGFLTGAFVFDSSYFGATSPILGQSYRLELSPFIGSIDFYTVLADYRRYFMPLKPFTLAFRILHFGRYGKGGEDSRLYPLYIGYETLVRGYNRGSFSVGEVESETNPFDYGQLFGSRMMVANVELRFPLFGVFGIGNGFYGLLPIEFNAFFDSGLAWWSDNQAWFLGGDRKPISSMGIGLRMNMFGYFILGAHLVNPLDRPNKDWYFQFTITPGF